MPKILAPALKYLLLFFTWTYKGSLKYYTLEPIASIATASHQRDEITIWTSLAEFRCRKEQELHFVQRAATLSAAAVIGVKSWSDAADSFWLAPVAWHCSFFLSIMALISSNQERLLERLPRVGEVGCTSQLRDALLTVLAPCRGNEGGLEKAEGAPLRSSPWLLFLWQTPLMLMHYSWLMFLTGYELFLITPLVRHASWTVQCTGAIISSVIGLLVVGQFHINAITTRQTLKHPTIVAVKGIQWAIPAQPVAVDSCQSD